MASYQETLTRALDLHPTLYHEETSVLHHLFFVNGNGYEWEGGQLVCDYGMTDEEYYKQHARFMRELWGMGSTVRHQEYTRLCALIKRKGLAVAGRWLIDQVHQDNHHFSVPTRDDLYPLCQYACILHIPDDVQPDWLDAARRAINWAYTVERTELDGYWLLQAEARLAQLRRTN